MSSLIIDSKTEIEKWLINFISSSSEYFDNYDDLVEDIITKKSKHSKFTVVSNPEFLREGNAINDFINPDRIVIGIPH